MAFDNLLTTLENTKNVEFLGKAVRRKSQSLL